MTAQAFLNTFTTLISHSSISAFDASWDQSNQPLVAYLAGRFTELGFSITIQDVPGSRGKQNMLAKLGSGEGGLLLAGHTDTVAFDESRWSSDPLKLRQADNRLYGLGSCDMKGFFAFILHALTDMPRHKLQKPLYVLATADEETSMAGARFFAEQQLIKPDVALIGEPTGLTPIYQHKGHMAHSLTIKGESGHSSDPDKGVNALEVMHEAIGQLLTLKQQLQQPVNPAFAVPHSTLNLGHIHGGDSENRICSHCQLNFDLRLLPGQNQQHVIEQIDDTLAPLSARYTGRISRELMYPPAPPFACKDGQDVLALAERLTGFAPQTANYATEAPYLQQLGCATLVLGPGSIEQAHQPDEYLSLDYVQPTLNLLQQWVSGCCL